ncbi:hypothetical protein DFH06DRAFT_1198406 [Mycena polygramma]|nr:hypothetical protein DFH06DRAFT_1198406 [Mycena polygramma]
MGRIQMRGHLALSLGVTGEDELWKVGEVRACRNTWAACGAQPTCVSSGADFGFQCHCPASAARDCGDAWMNGQPMGDEVSDARGGQWMEVSPMASASAYGSEILSWCRMRMRGEYCKVDDRAPRAAEEHAKSGVCGSGSGTIRVRKSKISWRCMRLTGCPASTVEAMEECGARTKEWATAGGSVGGEWRTSRQLAISQFLALWCTSESFSQSVNDNSLPLILLGERLARYSSQTLGDAIDSSLERTVFRDRHESNIDADDTIFLVLVRCAVHHSPVLTFRVQ